jgi:hypothetical protein
MFACLEAAAPGGKQWDGWLLRNADVQFPWTVTGRMIVAHDSESFATTGALKWRTLC